MDLFDSLIDPSDNLLPKNGTVNYYGSILPYQLANEYLDNLLLRIQWKHDEAIIMGKHIKTKRKVAWYGDHPYRYTYSKITRQALPWISELLELKTIVEQRTGDSFNSCLLNLYHNGEESMGWHSDAEKDLQRNGSIASISLGAERKFSFKHKQTKETVSLILQHGSLLVMKGSTQTYWQHHLPASKKITQPRVNLTFRTIVS